MTARYRSERVDQSGDDEAEGERDGENTGSAAGSEAGHHHRTATYDHEDRRAHELRETFSHTCLHSLTLHELCGALET